MTARVPVFYALGNAFIEARLECRDAVPELGAVVTLKERSLHTRAHEHCTRPCCAEEPTRQYRVVALSAFAGDNALQEVANYRAWEETLCNEHEWCSLFDGYTLEGYLAGAGSGPDDPDRAASAIVVDIAIG